MGELVKVTFYGDQLYAVRNADGSAHVALKPIVEGMGLAWHGQFQRVQRDPNLQKGIRVMGIPSAGGEQETVCLPLDMIPGWLMGVEANRVNPEIRDKVIRYQRECYEVLAAHFLSGGLRTERFNEIVNHHRQTHLELMAAHAKLDEIRRELKSSGAYLQLVNNNSSSMFKTFGEKMDDGLARIYDFANHQQQTVEKVDSNVIALRMRVEEIHPDRGNGEFSDSTKRRHRFFLAENRAGKCLCGCGIRIIDNFGAIIAGQQIQYHHADKRDSRKRTNCILMRFDCHQRYTLNLELRSTIDPLIAAYRLEFHAWDQRTPQKFIPGQATLF